MFGKRIQELRNSTGKSRKEIAIDLQVHESTYGKYELGHREPDIKTIHKIADYFNVSMDYLLGKTYDTGNSIKAVRIPVLGKIPAGVPIEAIEDVLDFEEVPADWGSGGKEYFALELDGDSMSPKYLSGDVVIFQITDNCENGQDCAVMVNGDESTFKKLVKQPNGIVLQPLNTSMYEPMFYSNKDVEELPVRVIGVAKEIRRKI